ncbi:MATE family efflux transporter [Alteribacillus sp. HJP-4]|uniref:MATE family efflux transporter n=1 Tax=Alteribacillus sp. HJP-4 TaxID=2775394 RepID=UPI0035CD1FE6
MYPTSTTSEKLKLFIHVMLPILATQIGMYGMNMFDTMMSGRAGAKELAGVAIGSSIWLPVFTGLGGVMMAMTPILSQHIGAGEKDKVPFKVLQGVYLSIALSVLVLIAGAAILNPVLEIMSLETDVQFIAKHYLIGMAFGIPALFFQQALRGFIDSLGQTRVTMIVTLLALPVNVAMNYLLIFGKFGFPELGGIGAGYASAVTYWFILGIAMYYTIKVKPFRSFRIFRLRQRVSFTAWKEILLIGLPIGCTIFFETSIFAAITLLMSEFSTEVIAAHQAAINFASLLYMLPLSIAFALTIVVGFEAGAERIQHAKQYARLGMLTAFGLGVIASVLIYFLRSPVTVLYTSNEEVAEWMRVFLIYAIFFQMSDAVATPIQGVLRGYKDVNVPFLYAFVSFWIIGLPLGYGLASFTDFGPLGYWIGIITALAAVASTLYFRLRKVQADALKSSAYG